jgi:CRP/FNR family transcriptional regulator, cyclic AMP receptor protein
VASLTRNQISNASFNSKAFLGRAGLGKVLKKYNKNEEIITQGEAAGAVFYIQKGRVKVTVLSEHGKEAVIGILSQGQFFGEACLDGEKLRTSTTHAMDECLLTSISKAAMIENLEAEPKFSAFFLAYLLSRNSRIEDDLIDQLFNSSERRLARLLPLLADFGKGGRRESCPYHPQSGNTGGNDRYDPVPREFLHEQVSEEGLHQLQWKNQSSSYAAGCSSARQASNQGRRIEAAGKTDSSSFHMRLLEQTGSFQSPTMASGNPMAYSHSRKADSEPAL